MPAHRYLCQAAHPKRCFVLLAVFWTGIVVISLLTTHASQNREMETLARNVARAYLDKDMLFRDWVSVHGGIYVAISQQTPPNPYLPASIVPERDITTPSGTRLTYVNPAYLTRQLHEFSKRGIQMSGRITSLNPISPHNAPDAWEARALQTFNHGTQEYSEVVNAHNRKTLRLMRPVLTEANCIPCHRHQGYKQGDIRGGLSVELPMTIFESNMNRQIGISLVGHGVFWILGIAGLYSGYNGLRLRTAERDRAEQELRRLNCMLENQASTDFLTGIANRRKFLELLEAYISDAQRYERRMALIFFDIDHFKSINDSFGHAVGDQVLKDMARLVETAIRQSDIFARIGGEEFTLLVHDNDIQSAFDLAEKLRALVAGHDFHPAGRVTCSFGVAHFCSDDTLEQLISRADNAMYTAKRAGRNRVAAAIEPISQSSPQDSSPQFPAPTACRSVNAPT